MPEKTVDQESQKDLSEKAWILKQESQEEPAHPKTDDDANEGMIPTPRPDQAPSGAFDAEGQRPVLERSRKVR